VLVLSKRLADEKQRQPTLAVLLTKEQIDPTKIAGSVVVVVDVLLSSTTILTILEHGANRVVPISNADEAEQIRQVRGSTLVTGGEYFGEKPEGFDIGPFPEDFSPASVSGADVAYLSTNGSPTILATRNASELLIGCIRNAPAISKYLNSRVGRDVYVICSGNGGRMSLEDFIAACVIVSMVDPTKWRFDDAAILAHHFGKDFQTKEHIFSVLKTCRLGHWFASRNKLDVLEFASDFGASNRLAKMKDDALVLLG
jgi:2-phosphosulfolactate phosphatase